MSKIRIVTDSSITIEPELVEKYNITIVPLSVMMDGVIYSDSDLREEGRFLEMMKNSKELPKTSQPPVGLFAETFEKLIKDGSETRKAKLNLYATLIGTFLLLMGVMCFFIKVNSVEYVDSSGLLHENFYLIPIGFLFLLSGGIVFLTTGIKYIKNNVKK